MESNWVYYETISSDGNRYVYKRYKPTKEAFVVAISHNNYEYFNNTNWFKNLVVENKAKL